MKNATRQLVAHCSLTRPSSLVVAVAGQYRFS